MAIFTPYTNPQNAPNYLGLSKEIDVPKTTSTVASTIEGGAKVLDLGVRAVDDINKNQIDKKLFQDISTARDQSLTEGMQALNPQESPAASVTPDANLEPLSSPNDNVPPAVFAAGKRVDTISQANRQGKMDDAQYYANMQAIVQNAAERNPGYARYIRDRATHWLGVDPATAQRAAIQRELAATQSEASRAANQWTNDVEKWMKYLGPEGTRAALTFTSDPAKQAQVRAYVAGQMASEHQQDRYMKDLDAEMKVNGVNAERSRQTLSLATGQMTSRMMDGVLTGMSISGRDIQNRIAEFQRTGTKPSADELSKLQMSFGQLEDAWERSFNEMVNAPRFNNGTASLGSIMKPEEVSQVREQYRAMFAGMRRQLTEGKLTLASSQAEWIRVTKDNATASVLALPTMQKLAGIEGSLGQSATAVINNMFTQNKWADLTKLGSTLTNMTIVNGSAAPLPNGVKTFTDVHAQATPGSTAKPAEVRAAIAATREGVLQNSGPEKNTGIAINWAKTIASGGTTDFFEQLSKKEQFDAFAQIAAPDISAKIKELSKSDPQLWNRYDRWMASTFQRLFNGYIDDVNRSSTFNERLNIKFNEVTKRIDYVDPRANLRGGNARSTGQGFEPIDRLNVGLGILKTHFQQTGEEMTEETLKKYGLDLTKRPEAPQWVNQVSDAIKGAGKLIEKAAQGNEAPGIFQNTPRAQARRGEGGEVVTIPVGAIPNQGPALPEFSDLEEPSMDRIQGVFEQIINQGTNEPLIEEGKRRLRNKEAPVIPPFSAPRQ